MYGADPCLLYKYARVVEWQTRYFEVVVSFARVGSSPTSRTIYAPMTEWSIVAACKAVVRWFESNSVLQYIIPLFGQTG